MFLFPFVFWLAIATSVVMLVLLFAIGDLGPGSGVVLSACLVLAGYCQFFAASAIVSRIGLAFQTLLAIYLIVRWRLTA